MASEPVHDVPSKTAGGAAADDDDVTDQRSHKMSKEEADAMNAIQVSREEQQYNERIHAKKQLQRIKVKDEDVALLVSECNIDENQAEYELRLANNDIEKAILNVIRVPDRLFKKLEHQRKKQIML
jgi:NACalpha-BTF3-like transcription factor